MAKSVNFKPSKKNPLLSLYYLFKFSLLLDCYDFLVKNEKFNVFCFCKSVLIDYKILAIKSIVK